MIYINDYKNLQQKVKITYNPISDMVMSLDVISDPGHHGPSSVWAFEVYRNFSRKEKDLFRLIESKIGGWLHLDEYINQYTFQDFNLDSSVEIINFVNDYGNWTRFPEDIKPESLTFFLETYCRNFFIDIIEEHQTLIKASIKNETTLSRTLAFTDYVKRMNPRVSIKKNQMVMEKMYSTSFNSEVLDVFYIKLSLFSFPHLVIDDRHDAGIFSLCMDLPFRDDDYSLKGSNSISTKAFALSDRTRLEILFMLSRQPMTQKELTIKMGLAKSTVSRHVNILMESKILYSADGERNTKLFINSGSIETISEEIINWLNLDTRNN